jgi:hypothetical protein
MKAANQAGQKKTAASTAASDARNVVFGFSATLPLAAAALFALQAALQSLGWIN